MHSPIFTEGVSYLVMKPRYANIMSILYIGSQLANMYDM